MDLKITIRKMKQNCGKISKAAFESGRIWRGRVWIWINAENRDEVVINQSSANQFGAIKNHMIPMQMACHSLRRMRFVKMVKHISERSSTNLDLMSADFSMWFNVNGPPVLQVNKRDIEKKMGHFSMVWSLCNHFQSIWQSTHLPNNYFR